MLQGMLGGHSCKHFYESAPLQVTDHKTGAVKLLPAAIHNGESTHTPISCCFFVLFFLAHSALKMNLIQHFKIKSKYWKFINWNSGVEPGTKPSVI